MIIEPFTDVVPSIFATLNQGPMTLTLVLHTIIVIPMFLIYQQEKARLEKEAENR
jgi:nicotinamide riboside transporter PnuC